jgi:ribosomal protein S18 acetylase RimI-like enzyme
MTYIVGEGVAMPEQQTNRTARLEARIAPEALAVAMIVDAKDESAQRFYERYGFKLLTGEARRLILPIDAALRKLALR